MVTSSTCGDVRPFISRDREPFEFFGQVCCRCAKGDGAQVLLGDADGLVVVVEDVEDTALPRCDLGQFGLECWPLPR